MHHLKNKKGIHLLFVIVLTISLVLTPLSNVTFAESESFDLEEHVNEEMNDETVEQTNEASSDEERDEEAEQSLDEESEERDNTEPETETTENKEEMEQVEIEATNEIFMIEETITEYDPDTFVLEVDGEVDITSTTGTINWSVNQDIVKEYAILFGVYGSEEYTRITVPGETTSYTFTDLSIGVEYQVTIFAYVDGIDEFVAYENIYFSTYWSDDEIYPVHFSFDVDGEYYEEAIIFRGLDESNEIIYHYEWLFTFDGVVYLPLGNYEVIVFNENEPSIAAIEKIEVKDDVDYAINPIPLSFNLQEMYENADPFTYSIRDITENSFTIDWVPSSASDFFEITLYENFGFEPIASNRFTNEDSSFTFTELSPDFTYHLEFFIHYLIDLEKYEFDKVKTNGEHSNADPVTFTNYDLKNYIAKELGVHYREVTEEDMKQLTELSINYWSNMVIDSLEGLQYAINLSHLSMWGNEIADLAPIANLTNLTYLDLEENYISDVSSLANLTNLNVLYMSVNKIEDVSELKNLENLEALSLYMNNISNISPLSNLNKLTYIDLDNNQIEDISALENLTNLDTLYLSDNNITSIDALSNLTNLERLTLASNNITKISALQNLEKLSYLVLSDNMISEIPDLSALTNLYELHLNNNEITDISGLKGMNDLFELDLSDNYIEDLSVLKELPNLQFVYLNGMAISDWETIEYLQNNDVYVEFDENFGEWEDEEIDVDAVHEAFPEDDGFEVSDDGTQIKLTISEEDSEEPITLTAEQISVLTNKEQTIEITHGDVTTSIPASAFLKSAKRVEIYVTKVEDTPDSFSDTYDFTIKQGSRNISEFQDGVTLTFHVDAARAKNPNNLKVHYFNEETGKWENIGGTYRDGVVTVITHHFSKFTVFEVDEEEDEDTEDTDEGEDKPVDEDEKPAPNEKESTYKESKDGKNAIFELKNRKAKESVNISASTMSDLKKKEQDIVIQRAGINVTIPSAIFNGNDEIEIIIEKAPKEKGSVSDTFIFTIKQGGKIIRTFNEEITLTFDVDPTNVSNTNNLKVHYFNENTGKWENIGGTYSNGKVTATTNHFSKFTVFEMDEDGLIVSVDEDAASGAGSGDAQESSGTSDSRSAVSSSGKQLPETATNDYNYILIGMLLVVAGVLTLFARPRKVKAK